MKSKFDSMLLENKIEQEFRNNNTKFSLYIENSIFPIVLYGKYENNVLTVYGDYKIKKGNIIVNECNKNIYSVESSSNVELNTKYNSNIYIRKGTKILLDDNVEEVKVIKVKNKYYLIKE